MCQEKNVTQQDFTDLKSKVDWLEIHGASAMTRKTMWLVREGCRPCGSFFGYESMGSDCLAFRESRVSLTCAGAPTITASSRLML